MKEDDLVEGNPDDGEESADDDPTPKSRKLARRHHTTPLRSAILVPIVRDAVAQRPVGVYIVMVGIDAIEIASDAIVIASQRSTDHILAGQTAT